MNAEQPTKPKITKPKPRREIILDWCKDRRPDVAKDLEYLMDRPDIEFLLAVAFVAGRTFQHNNPEVHPDVGV